MIVIPMCGTHECNQGRGVVCSTTGCGDPLRNAWKPPEQMTEAELARAYHAQQNAYVSGSAVEAAEILAAQAEGARMCGAWPYTGTPTSPGPLTEAELDAHNAEFHGPRVPRVMPALIGYRKATWWRKLWARWREWRASRMWPVDVPKR